ncbi:MAG: hemolysin III family protein [Flavobacteriaceae bacterium]|tara:strand:- start:2916 stop:3557 length:642 start_codon:yes stop_codon:yes gene_type:complete
MLQFISVKDYKNEEFWNSLTHFIGVILTVLGTPLLFYFDNKFTSLSTLSIILFSFGLFFVYSSSSVYHFVINPRLKKRFQILDHISIYYLILGSYAPVCLITLYEYSGINIFIVVLTLSIVGTLKKLFFTGRFKIISLLLYLAMGWLIVVEINLLFELLDSEAELLLIIGGLSYTIGIIFYTLDKIKYFHSIWHLFVLTGSVLHYLLIVLYIV